MNVAGQLVEKYCRTDGVDVNQVGAKSSFELNHLLA